MTGFYLEFNYTFKWFNMFFCRQLTFTINTN